MGESSNSPVCLVDARNDAAPAGALDPARCLFLGVANSRERARLLGLGVGEALPPDIALPELDHRARRLARGCLPRTREVGPLALDLLHRDARSEHGWLSLHPREFELLWRLAERPGERVSRERLLREVWRLDFEPGTNSVEVHVSRLRAKLQAAGIEGLIETDRQRGYRIGAARGALDQRLCA